MALRRRAGVKQAHRPGNRLIDRQPRVQRRIGILKDDLRSLAEVAQRASLEALYITAGKRDAASASIKRSSNRPRVDLPQPLSPTSPSVSPAAIDNDMSSTAVVYAGRYRGSGVGP